MRHRMCLRTESQSGAAKVKRMSRKHLVERGHEQGKVWFPKQ